VIAQPRREVEYPYIDVIFGRIRSFSNAHRASAAPSICRGETHVQDRQQPRRRPLGFPPMDVSSPPSRACPQCHEKARVRATIKSAVGSYYRCERCGFVWHQEADGPPRNGPDPARPPKPTPSE